MKWLRKSDGQISFHLSVDSKLYMKSRILRFSCCSVIVSSKLDRQTDRETVTDLLLNFLILVVLVVLVMECPYIQGAHPTWHFILPAA
jgi:hypothetical protein